MHCLKSIALLIFFILIHFNSFVCAQIVQLSENSLIPDPGIPIYPGFPDGHISFFKINDSTSIHVWAGYESYISSGKDIFHQDSLWGMVISKGAEGSFDNGGAWLYSVFKITELHWVGFYHAEDHEFAGYENIEKIAWKCAAHCESFDGGKTWIKNGPILTSWLDKPTQPAWGGTGDFSVVRDSINNRWLAYFVCPDGIGMAESKDALGKPGTWKKYFNEEFKTAGIGGKGESLSFSKGKAAGGNPSIIYYKPLNVWMLAYHDWLDKGIYYTYSYDLEHWVDAKLILKNNGSTERTWYPTWISEVSDQYCHGKLFLAYAHWDNVNLPYRNYKLIEVNVSGITTPHVAEGEWFTQSHLVLSETTEVSLSLYDNLGRLIKEYYKQEILPAGQYFISLEPYLSNGISFLKLSANNSEQIQKLIRW